MSLRLGIIVYTHNKKFHVRPIFLLNLCGVDSLNKFKLHQQIRLIFSRVSKLKQHSLHCVTFLGMDVRNIPSQLQGFI